MQDIKRGEIYLVSLESKSNKGSIQGGLTRPLIIVSNLMACKYSPIIHAVPTTGQINKKWMPTHVDIPMSSGCGLLKPSVALCEQVQLFTREDFIDKIGFCNDYIMSKIDFGLMVQFGLVSQENKIMCI